jgi:hypothetical protein
MADRMKRSALPLLRGCKTRTHGFDLSFAANRSQASRAEARTVVGEYAAHSDGETREVHLAPEELVLLARLASRRTNLIDNLEPVFFNDGVGQHVLGNFLKLLLRFIARPPI